MLCSAEEAKDKLSEHDLKTLHEKADEVIIWLHKNKRAEGHHYAEKLKELERFVTPINANTSVTEAVLALRLELYNTDMISTFQ